MAAAQGIVSELTVVEIGGGLRDYTSAASRCSTATTRRRCAAAGRGTTLAPWPNRLRDGRYSFGGRPSSSRCPSRRSTTRSTAWSAGGRGPCSTRPTPASAVEVALLPQPGYPFSLRVSQRLHARRRRPHRHHDRDQLGAARSRTGWASTPTSLSARRHVDDDLLTVPGADLDRRSTNAACPPAARRSKAPLRLPRPRGDRRPGPGHRLHRPGPRRRGPGDGHAVGRRRSISVWADASFPYLQVFTGDTLPEDQRRRGLAVEPMTCPRTRSTAERG